MVLSIIDDAVEGRWEMYNPAKDCQATPTDTAETICNAVIPGERAVQGHDPLRQWPRPVAARATRSRSSELRCAPFYVLDPSNT